MNVAVLASGSGTNLQALLDSERAGTLGARVRLVISNRKTAGALDRARRHGCDALHLSPAQFPSEQAYAEKLQHELDLHRIDLVCLAGYLKKLPESLVTAYAGRIVNIHPAPLPRFGGPGQYGHHVHQAVLESGVSHSGPTVHFVDHEYDSGPIIAHVAVPVEDGDTPESLAARVLTEEHKLYPRVVAALAGGRIRWIDGHVVGSVDAS